MPFVGRREELLRELTVDSTSMAKQCAVWAKALDSSIGSPWPAGIVLENKGLSLTVHYRQAPDRQSAREQVLAAIGPLHPAPRILPGLHACNLLPLDAPDKWHALDRLVRAGGYETALYAGDEETDERVFQQAPDDWVTVRVGQDEGSAARFVLPDQLGITNLLLAILVAIGGQETVGIAEVTDQG